MGGVASDRVPPPVAAAGEGRPLAGERGDRGDRGDDMPAAHDAQNARCVSNRPFEHGAVCSNESSLQRRHEGDGCGREHSGQAMRFVPVCLVLDSQLHECASSHTDEPLAMPVRFGRGFECHAAREQWPIASKIDRPRAEPPVPTPTRFQTN